MSRYVVLNGIDSPEDLRALDKSHLVRLCAEMRHFLVRCVSETGGHLASNLGAVELTVALHRIFESPKDQIVWDVGHQCYAHKLLTGRKNRMHTLRQKDGLSGFTKQTESIHDSFVSGHSSTSISVADGLARAKRLKGEEGRVIAVIGDGAFTGGLAYEGLNNAARNAENLIIILNDNEMSISRNVGSMTRYLSKLRTNKGYFRLKDMTKSAMGSLPVVGSGLVDVVTATKSQLKNAVYNYNASFFEDMGYVHMGPIDGHDVLMLCDVLERAQSLKGPVFIHVETKKGKGYPHAERNPGAYHSVGRFDPAIGAEEAPSEDSYSAVFGRHLTERAEQDKRICAVTAAMKYGTGLNYFSKRFRSRGRFFDVGIAEQHGVTFCAALATKGLLPVFAVYSSFLQRAYDQLIHDCSIEQQHIVLAVDRAGLVGEDGETHQGLFDCAYLSSIPGVVIYSPAGYDELRKCMDQALHRENGLCAVRYPRGRQPALPAEFETGSIDYVYQDCGSRELLLVTYGRLVAEVSQAVQSLADQGGSASVLKLTRVWPLDPEVIRIAAGYRTVFFVEEGMRTGGIGEHFLLELTEYGFQGSWLLQAVNGRFVAQGTVPQQMKELGLDSAGILRRLEQYQSERKHA